MFYIWSKKLYKLNIYFYLYHRHVSSSPCIGHCDWVKCVKCKTVCSSGNVCNLLGVFGVAGEVDGDSLGRAGERRERWVESSSPPWARGWS